MEYTNSELKHIELSRCISCGDIISIYELVNSLCGYCIKQRLGTMQIQE